MTSPKKLDLTDYLLIAEEILGIEAERLARVVKVGPVESALEAPFAGFGEVDLYLDAPTKAGVLCSRLVRNHPLPDGNKRCAYVCLREFLARNNVRWLRPDNDEVAEMIERLAASEVSEEDFVAVSRDFAAIIAARSVLVTSICQADNRAASFSSCCCQPILALGAISGV